MAQYKFILPKMGESVAEATIINWLKKPGDAIEIDDTVLEVATDKVDSEVPSPVKGILIETFFKENDVVQIGDVIATIEISEGDVEETAVKQEDELPIQNYNDIEEVEIPYIPSEEVDQINTSQNEYSDSNRFYSPLVKSIASEEGISLSELDSIQGSGADGRVTKDDLLAYVNKRNGKSYPIEAQVSVTPEIRQAEAKDTKQSDRTEISVSEEKTYKQQHVVASSGSDEIIEMDRMRRLISDHMVMSKETSVHVTSFVEADVTNLVKWRDKVKSGFEKREGEKITFTPIFIEAIAKAIKDFPMINISVQDNKIIKKKDINIGMAAALPNGNLIVPVIKNADQLNLVGLTKSVNDLGKRAKVNKLAPDEIQGGTFTMSNIGMFGNIMGTPIINQPQVAILAVGVIKKKPAVIETEYGDVIAIRHMMYLSMSYDHRVVDGSLGGMFLRKVADYLEQWDSDREI
ncbi:catalytic domain-containing protein of components of various dehydrogenase complexes [Pseudopedobacter saltans DSM 12145]|uniref:Dihydrolipoamide acetyltransferase component of pyruvate dehydrogenase complex n=1 Tax=Pseudopedobacter saltans (strain ATCC 51119 / DSM 12145 / JCM 21818 / CCUG 39354 / LMG 10337 / NBRC 100064 / NCIMB 13643) TaxID=762903 RepID=F0S4J1_PSESL|nr:dihydrolipoamide acetyltransferase family protein [Pseudopedobacter saltans]ADY51982.1 catalytic domain-containing protein of components of various dehydrogenase complexes [Pseudopedobacter saltans DSM 12145]